MAASGERSDDITWIEEKLRSYPIWERNAELCQVVLDRILPSWQRDLQRQTKDCSRQKDAWKKVSARFPKEINEAEPIIRFIADFLLDYDCDGVPVTIVDLCSGFGISSMILSEILPASKVSRIWMVDKMWPHDPSNPTEGNLSTTHLSGRSYPIPLKYRKTDIKAGREIRQIHKHVFDAAPGPIILMGIHLCKSLAVRAIHLYQASEKIVAFALKPCCLPGRKMAFNPKTPIVWEFENGYSFGPRDLYARRKKEDSPAKGACEPVEGEVVGCNSDENEGVGDLDNNDEGIKEADCRDGESHYEEHPAQIHNVGHSDPNFTNERFSKWVKHLKRGCETKETQVRVDDVKIMAHHFQNKFIYCTRVTTTYE